MDKHSFQSQGPVNHHNSMLQVTLGVSGLCMGETRYILSPLSLIIMGIFEKCTNVMRVLKKSHRKEQAASELYRRVLWEI